MKEDAIHWNPIFGLQPSFTPMYNRFLPEVPLLCCPVLSRFWTEMIVPVFLNVDASCFVLGQPAEKSNKVSPCLAVVKRGTFV